MDWRRTSPLGLVVRATMNMRNAVFPILALLFGSRGWEGGNYVALIGIPAIVALNLLIAWAGWRHFRYRLADDHISVEHGLLSRAARAVPYERIQDVSLEQSVIPRLFGMVEVKFETGAGGKDELKIAYVTEAEGAALRETVRARKDGSAQHSADVAAESNAEMGRTLFAMDLPRLLTFGVFEFSLVVFAVLAGAAQQFDFLLPFDFWDARAWWRLAAGRGDWLMHLGLIGQIAGVGLAAAVLALLGLVTGLARTVLRDWDFRLEHTDKGLRRRRGLLSRSDVVMPLHRVQALSIATGIIRRRFGWHGLSIISLAHDSAQASYVAVPFGTMEEIEPVVESAGFTLPAAGLHWHRGSPHYRAIRSVAGAGPVCLAGIGFSASGMLWAGLGIFAAAGLLALRQLHLWRHDRHGIDDQFLYSLRGWLAPHLDIASRRRLQSVEIRRGTIGRRFGYADLNLGLAGGTFVMHGIAFGDAQAMRDAVLDSIVAVDFSRLTA